MAIFKDGEWYLVITLMTEVGTSTDMREFYGPFNTRYNPVDGPNIQLERMGFKMEPESDATVWMFKTPSGKNVWAEFKKGEWIKEGHLMRKPRKEERVLPKDHFISSQIVTI